MIRRICPICDQVMAGKHYCRTCHSWVRHPRIQDVTYYLNERHPQKESSCAYHSEDFDSVHKKSQKKAEKKKSKADKAQRDDQIQKVESVWQSGDASKTGKNEKKNKSGKDTKAVKKNEMDPNRDWEETFGRKKDKSDREGGGKTIGAFSAFLIMVVIWKILLSIWDIIQTFF
ncbi:hypothetical protein [Brotaphodocola sp.]|uniref:hypothetical protein n=1 Tax=Brotaphodocola sp. TaxID=3073577 RepID=UPI003D7EBA50